MQEDIKNQQNENLKADEKPVQKSDIKEPNFQKIEQILNIDITCLGNFKDMLSYINGLEESKLVVDLHKMDINSTQKDLGAKLSISVWGMKY